MKRKTIIKILMGLLLVTMEMQAQNASELTLGNQDTALPSHFKVDTEDGNSQMELLNTTTDNSQDKHTIFKLVNKRASGVSDTGGATLLLLDYDYSNNNTSGVNKSSLVLRNDDLNHAFMSFWNHSPFHESRLIEINGSGSWAKMNLSTQHATKMKWEFDGNAKMQINDQGQLTVNTVSIPANIGGRDLSNFKLFVNGGLLAKEVVVRIGWADYVFNPSYKLLSLNDVDKFISINRHLPNVPSSLDVVSNGLSLGQITKIQQEKIEELFLYTIQQEKEIEKLKAQNEDLITLLEKVAELERKFSVLTRLNTE